MARDDQQRDDKPETQPARNDSLQARKAGLLKRYARRSQTRLRPDEIGVVKVEFTVPASRLFGGNSIITGGRGEPLGLTDTDADDPVYHLDTDPNDGIITIPVPGPEVDT